MKYFIPTCLLKWNRQSVPNHRHIKFRKETRIKVKIKEFYIMSGVVNVSRLCPYAVLHQGRFEL